MDKLKTLSAIHFIVIVVAVLFNTSTLAHTYPKLSKTKKASAYIRALENNHIYALSTSSSGLLRTYYTDMKFKNKWEDKDRILKDPAYYQAIRSFSGEICAMIWRHKNRAVEQRRIDDVTVGKKINLTTLEQTPFFAPSSPWSSEDYTILYKGRLNAYNLFLESGDTYQDNSIGYPIHTVGLIFGKNSSKLKKNLVLSLQIHYLSVKDGEINDETLLKGDLALLSMILLPYSYHQIGAFSSQRAAFEACDNNSRIIIPAP